MSKRKGEQQPSPSSQPSQRSTKLPPALLASIIEAPDDDGPRLVLADALLAANDPRGELITIQCALAADDRMPAMTKSKRKTLASKERKLLNAHAKAWQAEIGLEKCECTFRRGFIERIDVDDDTPFGPLIERAWKQTPIRELEIEGREPFDQLLDHPLMMELTSLSAARSDVVEEDLRRLASNTKLESFTTTATTWGPAEIKALSTWPSFKSLALYSLPITIKLVEAIVRSSFASRLVKLDLRCADEVGKSQVAHIVAKASWPSLKELALVQHKIDDTGPEAIAKAPGLAKLELLNLALNEFGDRGAEAIARSSTLSKLHTLDLSFNKDMKKAAALFADRKNLAALKALDLSYVTLGRGAKAKLEARFGKRLEL